MGTADNTQPPPTRTPLTYPAFYKPLYWATGRNRHWRQIWQTGLDCADLTPKMEFRCKFSHINLLKIGNFLTAKVKFAFLCFPLLCHIPHHKRTRTKQGTIEYTSLWLILIHTEDLKLVKKYWSKTKTPTVRLSRGRSEMSCFFFLVFVLAQSCSCAAHQSRLQFTMVTLKTN